MNRTIRCRWSGFSCYANQYNIEGLIATTSTWMRNRIRPDVIESLLDAYAQVQPRLNQHEAGFPSAQTLRPLVVGGQPAYGMSAVGPDRMTAGAELIVKAAEKTDPRPLWILGWGGTNTLAQALLHMRATRTAVQLDALVSRLRVYAISDQDDAGPWIRREFPRCTTSSRRRRQTATSTTSRRGRASAETGSTRTPAARTSRPSPMSWMNANIRSQGPLGKRISAPMLYP